MYGQCVNEEKYIVKNANNATSKQEVIPVKSLESPYGPSREAHAERLSHLGHATDIIIQNKP
jgi:hypothetical protein